MECSNINFDDIPSSISEFFTQEEFAKISDYEKQHLSNLRQNFEALRRAGLPVTPPEFMCRNRSKKERRKLVTPAIIDSSDGSDSEWTPALEKLKRPQGNQRKRLFEPLKKASVKDNTKEKVPGPTKRKKQVYYGDSYARDLGINSPKCGRKLQRKSNLQESDANTDNDGLPVTPPEFMLRSRSEKERRKLVTPAIIESSDGSDSEWTPALEKPKRPQGNQRKRLFEPLKKASVKDNTKEKVPGPTKRKKQRKKQADSGDEEEEVHVHPFRKTRMSSYMSLATLGDDDFLYCEECRQQYDGDCPVHGPLLVVDDVQVQLTPLSECDEYSKRTLPQGLVIQKSKIPHAGLGVFAVRDFPARARFGPYRGKKEVNETIAHESGYSWQIMKDGQTSHFVDGEDPSRSNWMRYVNCARHEDEQCVTAYQYQGEIYYRSHKPIRAGTEILVYYGDSYARDLGINSPKFGRKLQRKSNLQESDANTDNDGIFSCADCHLFFIQSWCLQRHMKYRHYDKYLEQNCNKLHADLSLVVNGLTNVENKHEKCDVNRILNDIDSTKLTVETLSESIKNRVNTVNVSEAEISYNVSSQNDYTDEENDQLCVSNICTNLTRDDECDIECNIVQSSISEDSGKKYKICDVKSKEFHKMYLQKDSSKSIGGSTYNPGDTSTMDFANICSVQVHKRIHTGEKPYKCDVCNVGFTQSGNLKTHKRIHTGEKPYKCDVCNVGFTQSGSLKTHKRIHTGEKPYKCDVCNVGFTVSGHLKNHKRIHTGEKPYKCDVCNVGFYQSGHLKNHKRIHTREKPYKCDVCNVGFTVSGHLKNHKRIHTGEKPYKCDVCNVGFTESCNLKKHKRIHTGEKPYKCDVCNVGFTERCNLKKHKRIHTGEKPYKCDVCNVGFTESGSLNRHKRIHTGEKPYKCDVCNVGFYQSGHLKNHKRIHTREKPYKCDVCNVGFTVSGHLKNHKRIHTGEKPYKCDVCNVGFTESCNLKKHKRIHTGEKPYKCDVCNVGFTERCNLKKHKRIHTGEKPYKCDVCNVGFTESCNLKKHKRIHTREKPYKCDVCNVGFTVSGHLKDHKRIHTGEKPYKCDVCNVGFYQSGHLKNHKRIHTREKPYKCDVCNVGFTVSGHLKNHKRIHTGEKPYKCDVCNVGFTQSGDLKKHKRIHTGEKPYKCDVCNVGFTESCNLKKHKRIHTREKPYKCDVCNVGFTVSGHLKDHKRIHTREKPYKCDVCNVGFTVSCSLKRHKRIHTGEKPYKCDVCNVGFTQSGDLKTHKRIHTGEKPYKCDICSVRFTYSVQLKQHRKQHTGH